MWWRVGMGCFIAFAAMDFFTWHGAPYFRYTGSDLAYPVWNLGWPLAVGIYDSRSGIHIGPFLFAVVPFQALVLSLIAVGAFLSRKRHNPPLKAAAPPCC
jgi:hypothetical protein